MNNRALVNVVLQRLQFGGKPILVLGHGRSGTTWVAETLAYAKGTLLYQEPGRPDPSTYGNLNQYWFRYVRPDEADPFLSTAFRDAKFGLSNAHNSTWNRDRRNWAVRLKPGYRVVIKDVATMSSPLWAFQFLRHPKIVFLIRNPCAVIASEVKRNIDSKASMDFVLQDAGFAALLSKEERQYLQAIENQFERYGALWAVRHRPIQHEVEAIKDLTLVHYEDIASDPVGTFKALYQQLTLDWTSTIQERIESSTTKETPGAYSVVKRSVEHIDRWRTTLDEEAIAYIQKAIHRMNGRLAARYFPGL